MEEIKYALHSRCNPIYKSVAKRMRRLNDMVRLLSASCLAASGRFDAGVQGVD